MASLPCPWGTSRLYVELGAEPVLQRQHGVVGRRRAGRHRDRRARATDAGKSVGSSR